MRRTTRYGKISEQETAYNHGYEFSTLNGGSTVEHYISNKPSEYDQVTGIGQQDTSYHHGYEFTTLNEESAESTVEHHMQIKPSEYDQVAGNRLQRFLLRTTVGVLGPFVVCAYFIVIWRLYLVPAQAEGPFTFGVRGAKWIFYSWFVAGVLGLSLSLYGLTGVEASMLMEPTWNVGDAARLMLHADNTWSGPGGWVKTIRWAMLPRKARCRRLPPCLWFMLALPSMLVFIAWPLSGLTMETTQGYRRPDVTTPASVFGFSYDTFNEREISEAFQGAMNMWRNRAEARVPGVGIVYTQQGFDRSQNAFLNQVPAVLPRDDGIPPIFLVPQGEDPVEGNHWGLLLQYNCTVVDRAQNFTIINKFKRPQSRYSRLIPLSPEEPSSYLEYSKDTNTALLVFNSTNGPRYDNLDAVVEFGAELSKEELSTEPHDYSCYLQTNKSMDETYPSMHEEQIFEVALWQALQNYTFPNSTRSVPYNFSIDHNITDFYGEYNVGGFRALRPSDSSLSMTAIGAQCRVSSSVGRADINGIKSSYSNFQRTDTRIATTSSGRCANRFEASIIPTVWIQNAAIYPWSAAIFMSASARSSILASNEGMNESGSGFGERINLQPAYLQAEELRQSLLSAYADYAMMLMYNGGLEYTTSNGSTLRFTNPNVTAFQSDTVIKPGVVPAVIPLSFFCVWALVSSALGLVYGFRRRWTETLDGHTMFRMGAELSDHARRELLKTSNIGKKEDDKALNDIPGMVGDTKPEMYVGRIGLVTSGKAEKKKLYE